MKKNGLVAKKRVLATGPGSFVWVIETKISGVNGVDEQHAHSPFLILNRAPQYVYTPVFV